MKPLVFLPVSVLLLAIAGCGEESDELPVDGRDFDGVQYSVPAPYTGRVIDGYLKNARVWLDLDGDSQYTPGPMEFVLPSGKKITLPDGEPTTMSGEGGQFSLDTSGLELPSSVGRNIDPREFPLYALALPGKTLEQTHHGDMEITRGFLLSAAPGVRNVTPLTTLDRYRRLAELGPLMGSGNTSLSGLAGINLLKDYIFAKDDRSHAYAQAMVRFMASQFPDHYNDSLAEPGSDGTERLLSQPAAFLLGISLVQNADEIIAAVDSFAGGDYANVDVDQIADFPEVPLELSDPVLLTSQRIFARSERSNDLPVRHTELTVSAELTFDYSEDGRLQSISSNGCLAPSMQEIARLVNVKGYMASLSPQWLPSASLSLQSHIAYTDPGIDEILKFDWENRAATFETGTTCHPEGVEPGSTELGGIPEITYSWDYEGGKLERLVATIAQQHGTVTRTLVPEFANASEHFPGYRITEDGVELESLIYSANGLESCAIDDDVDEALAAHVVTGFQSYVFSGYAPQPPGFTGLSLEFDTRGEFNRPLRYGFLAPDMAELSHVDSERGFEWALYYPAATSETSPDGAQNLIRDAYLKDYTYRACGREFEDERTASAYAKISYHYQNLSEYLVELLR